MFKFITFLIPCVSTICLPIRSPPILHPNTEEFCFLNAKSRAKQQEYINQQDKPYKIPALKEFKPKRGFRKVKPRNWVTGWVLLAEAQDAINRDGQPWWGGGAAWYRWPVRKHLLGSAPSQGHRVLLQVTPQNLWGCRSHGPRCMTLWSSSIPLQRISRPPLWLAHSALVVLCIPRHPSRMTYCRSTPPHFWKLNSSLPF